MKRLDHLLEMVAGHAGDDCVRPENANKTFLPILCIRIARRRKTAGDKCMQAAANAQQHAAVRRAAAPVQEAAAGGKCSELAQNQACTRTVSGTNV
jgi:hypothetical protein